MNNQLRYKDVTDSNDERDEESDGEPPKRKVKKKFLKIKAY